MKFTLPSSIFKLFKLGAQISHSSEQSEPKVFKKVFEYCRTLIDKLGTFQPMQAIKMYLEFLLLINELDKAKFYDEFTYVKLYLFRKQQQSVYCSINLRLQILLLNIHF